LLSLSVLNKLADSTLKTMLLTNWFLKSLTLKTMSVLNKPVTPPYGTNKTMNALKNSNSELKKSLLVLLLPVLLTMPPPDVLLLTMPHLLT